MARTHFSGPVYSTAGFGTTNVTGTAAAGAVTLAGLNGKVTTEALTTAQNASYTLTITNSQVAAADTAFVSLANGTNSQGTPVVVRVTPGAGTLTIIVKNMHDSAQALNGTLVVSFFVVKG